LTDDSEVVLTLYGRTYCHLCDDMIAALQPLRSRFRFTLHIVDVDSDPRLEERYGEKVPVLMAGDSELCHYFLDLPAVTAVLAKIR
jgi:thiol-disulfide isomerase/thioredoxin